MIHKIPKNCGHCFFYSSLNRTCTKYKIPIGNINTCEFWHPLYEDSMSINTEFIEYNQYKIEVKM